MDLSDALDGFPGSGNQSGGGGGGIWPGQPSPGPVWPGQPPANPLWGGGNPAQPSGPGGFPGPASGGFPSPNPGPASGGFPGPNPGPASGGFPGLNPGPASGGFPSPNNGPASGGFPSPNPGPGFGGFPNPAPGPGGFPNPAPGPGGFPSPIPSVGPGFGGSRSHNLVVPFNQALHAGFQNKMLITIRGTIKANANKITVDLSTDRDLAFHLNPRFNENGQKVVVRNSRINGQWGKEERQLQTFPFAPGQEFELKILCTDTGFKVAVNSSHLFDYRHRIHDLKSIKKLSIYNDLTLSSCKIDHLP